MLRLRQRSIHPVDRRLQLLDQHSPVAVALASAHPDIAGRRILGHSTNSRVRDSHQNHWLNLTIHCQPVRGCVRPPGSPRQIRGSSIEQILSIVQIEDREAPVLFLQILRRHIHHHMPVVRQDVGMKCIYGVTWIFAELIFLFRLATVAGKGRWGFALRQLERSMQRRWL